MLTLANKHVSYLVQTALKSSRFPPTGDGSVISLSLRRFNRPSGGHLTDRCQTDRTVREENGIKKNSSSWVMDDGPVSRSQLWEERRLHPPSNSELLNRVVIKQKRKQQLWLLVVLKTKAGLCLVTMAIVTRTRKCLCDNLPMWWCTSWSYFHSSRQHSFIMKSLLE